MEPGYQRESAPDDSEVLEFVRTLRTGCAAIESEFVVVDDPDGQMRARMALVYDNNTTDRFFGLLDEKTVTDVPHPHVQATLKQAILDVGQGKIAYDNLRKRLSYTGGVLPDAIRDALKAVPGVTQAFKDAVDELHRNRGHCSTASRNYYRSTMPMPPRTTFQRRSALIFWLHS